MRHHRSRKAHRPAAAAMGRTVGMSWRWVRHNKIATMVVATGAVGLTLLAGLEAAAERGGHSLDPTDAMNYNTYALRNDSPAALYVHLCSDRACARLDEHFEWIPLRPGSATDEQVYWGSDGYAIYAVAGAPTTAGAHRCLVLNASTKAATTVDAPLSAALRCAS
jgi:hypothetical protein